MGKLGTKKRVFLALFLAVSATISVVFVLRGPYMSNYLKRLILRELQNATGRQVIAQDIYVSVFPFFVGARDIKAFDDDGKKTATIATAKAYIGFTGILKGDIDVNILYLGKPEVWTSKADSEKILENIKKYTARKKKKTIQLNLKTIEIRDGGYSFLSEGGPEISNASGASAFIRLRETPEISLLGADVSFSPQGWPEFKGTVEAEALIKDGSLELKRLKAVYYGSEVIGSGGWSEGKGNFMTDLNLLMESAKKVFGLKNSGEGRINATGNVSIANTPADSGLDLSVRGNFYLETLMEFLNVSPEHGLKGWVNFKGKVIGRLSDIKAEGTARLRRGGMFGVRVDDLSSRVRYGGGKLDISEGRAKLYGGQGEAEASISIPGAAPFTLYVKVSEVDSIPVSELAGIKNIPIPQGKVEGELYSSGQGFNPEGRFKYSVSAPLEARPSGADIGIIGRLRRAEGAFQMSGGLISLHSLTLSTGLSRAVVDGEIDRASGRLDISARLKTGEASDLSSPYFTRVHGVAEADLSITGTSAEPEISADLRGYDVLLDRYRIGDAEATVFFRKGLLELRNFYSESVVSGSLSKHEFKGNVAFPEAKSAFDFASPDYDLEGRIRGASLQGLLKVVFANTASSALSDIDGTIDAEADVKGKTPLIEGKCQMAGLAYKGYAANRAEMSFSYDMRDFKVGSALLARGGSHLSASGSISKAGEYEFRVWADSLLLNDISPKSLPFNYEIALDAQGKGTLKNPEAQASARLTKGTLSGARLGDGRLSAELKGEELALSGDVLGGLLGLNATAAISGEMPWKADVELRRGRYDFLLRLFMKNLPEDALLSAQGSASLKGTKQNIEADVTVKQLNAAFYGQDFSNDSDLLIAVSDRKVSFGTFSIRSGEAIFTLGGSLDAGRNYDLSVLGKASLAPLAAISDRIELLRGSAEFAFSVKGKWQEPEINGDAEISGAALGVKGLPQRVTSISAGVRAEGGKLILRQFSGKAGGGEIEARGVANLKGFAMEKLSLDVLLNSVNFSFSKNFSVNFGGNLVVKGDSESQSVTGDLRINRAKYAERVEWKSWLLSAKRAEAPVAPSRLERVKLNVRVYGTEKIRIDNNIARASLKADMFVRGTLGHPVLFGRLEAREGRIYFRNNEFKIVSATADYTDPSRKGPFFAIVAETFSRGYHVFLTLEGYPDKFNLTLHSDPPLDEVSILALLTVGQFGENLRGLEGGLGAGEAASFLTGKYQDVFEERFRDITGLDRVQIDPYVSKTAGGVVPRITVSKRLIGEKVYVTYSTAVGVSEEQVLKLEYVLTGNVSLVGERDERGSVGGDIKFRFEFK